MISSLRPLGASSLVWKHQSEREKDFWTSSHLWAASSDSRSVFNTEQNIHTLSAFTCTPKSTSFSPPHNPNMPSLCSVTCATFKSHRGLSTKSIQELLWGKFGKNKNYRNIKTLIKSQKRGFINFFLGFWTGICCVLNTFPLTPFPLSLLPFPSAPLFPVTGLPLPSCHMHINDFMYLFKFGGHKREKNIFIFLKNDIILFFWMKKIHCGYRPRFFFCFFFFIHSSISNGFSFCFILWLENEQSQRKQGGTQSYPLSSGQLLSVSVGRHILLQFWCRWTRRQN